MNLSELSSLRLAREKFRAKLNNINFAPEYNILQYKLETDMTINLKVQFKSRLGWRREKIKIGKSGRGKFSYESNVSFH